MSSSDPLHLAGLPRDEGGPVFRAPWEAQAFALTLMLFERGCFGWTEWAERLGAEIAAARERRDAEDGNRYYEYWLAALEKLAIDKGLTTLPELFARKSEWDRAARATPHGKPIVLPER